jgi:hypothetical protein
MLLYNLTDRRVSITIHTGKVENQGIDLLTDQARSSKTGNLTIFPQPCQSAWLLQPEECRIRDGHDNEYLLGVIFIYFHPIFILRRIFMILLAQQFSIIVTR